MLLRYCTLLICHVSLVVANPPPRRHRESIPGVGFSLSSVHVTAAVYYENGAWAEVAHVEGSSTYKAFMRKSPSTEVDIQDINPEMFTTDPIFPVLDPFQHASCRPNPDLESVTEVLRSLKAAVVSQLGMEFCYAQIALPDPDWNYQTNITYQALASINLRPVFSVLDAAPTALWASVLATTPLPRDGEIHTVLGIEYSDSGLNVSLWGAEYEGYVDYIRGSNDGTLGERNRGRPGYQNRVKDFLEEITQRPFGDNGWGYQYQERLERVVLYGDATTDEEFLKTLNLVVGSKLPETQGLDPVYAVAVGAAQAAYFAAVTVVPQHLPRFVSI
ncbi:hypothetical protein CC79DRAFT_1359739 [Sarocladium strictum]